MLTYGHLGKYMKRLVGRTDIEDALGRLERLLQDEIGMATTQGLKATHEVNNQVKGVDDKVQGIDSKMQRVDDRVRDVDDKIDLVIDGVQFTLNQPAHLTEF
jgi:archaellum component FlaC